MKPLVEQVKQKYTDTVPFDDLSLDTQANLPMADRYGIQAVPTLVFIAKDGSVANKLIGVATAETIEQNVESIKK